MGVVTLLQPSRARELTIDGDVVHPETAGAGLSAGGSRGGGCAVTA
jgi:hypothetical protein